MQIPGSHGNYGLSVVTQLQMSMIAYNATLFWYMISMIFYPLRIIMSRHIAKYELQSTQNIDNISRSGRVSNSMNISEATGCIYIYVPFNI